MKTVTFYAYKGGTGRTLLVANAARYLASIGKRVVALDLDFEAPGLHYKLRTGRAGTSVLDSLPQKGAVDFLLDLLEGDAPPPTLQPYLQEVALPPGSEGALMLFPAGAAPSAEYWHKLARFASNDGSGGRVLAAFLELKERIEKEFHADYLLIDARTGITEVSGIASTAMADDVVCMFLSNQESIDGASVVIESLGDAPRLPGQRKVGVHPVLSRANGETANDVRGRLPKAMSSGGRKLELLRSDVGLEKGERLYVDDGESSPLLTDYLRIFSCLFEERGKRPSNTEQRMEAIVRLRSQLLDGGSGHYRRGPFSVDAIRDGVQVKLNNKVRYADLVVSPDKEDKPVMIIEYVDDLSNDEPLVDWKAVQSARCVVLVGKENTAEKQVVCGRADQWEDFKRTTAPVPKPIDFKAFDNPCGIDLDGKLDAIARGHEEYVADVVETWLHSSFVGLHGGSPWEPGRARQILDGLARVRKPQIERHILHRTLPEVHYSRHRDMMREGDEETLITAGLFLPLFWRVSIEGKLHIHRRGPRHSEENPALRLTAADLLGLTFDPDSAFRTEAGPVATRLEELHPGDGTSSLHNVASLWRDRVPRFDWSDNVPPELLRRALFHCLKPPERPFLPPSVDQDHALAEARAALVNQPLLKNLLHEPTGALSIPICNLLAEYDPVTCKVTFCRPLLTATADLLRLDERPLGAVVYLHVALHVLMHLGRDLDGDIWRDFSQPSSNNPAWRPSSLHEGLAQYFTYRMLRRLGDEAMMTAFERLTDVQPQEYQQWRQQKNVPVETMRRRLMQVRRGADWEEVRRPQ